MHMKGAANICIIVDTKIGPKRIAKGHATCVQKQEEKVSKLHTEQKRIYPLKISSVNVNESEENYQFYSKKLFDKISIKDFKLRETKYK